MKEKGMRTNGIAAIDRTTVTVGTASTSTSTVIPSPTTVYVTTTLAGGGLATIPVEYSQSFSSMYSVVASPKSGSVGLGTISGTVGTVKAAEYLTQTY